MNENETENSEVASRQNAKSATNNLNDSTISVNEKMKQQI